jgi:hypothetical protein
MINPFKHFNFILNFIFNFNLVFFSAKLDFIRMEPNAQPVLPLFIVELVLNLPVQLSVHPALKILTGI